MVIDLPEIKGGINSGPTAIELCVMGFSGCVGTIFAVVAEKMRLTFSAMEIVANAEQPDGAPTITSIHFVMTITTTEAPQKIEKCLDTTVSTCPVGVLYTQAGIKITHEIIFK